MQKRSVEIKKYQVKSKSGFPVAANKKLKFTPRQTAIKASGLHEGAPLLLSSRMVSFVRLAGPEAGC